MSIHVIGYVRVSTSQQEHGPAAQRLEIERWCEREGATLVSIHQDIVSGAASLDARPGLTDALADLRPGYTLLVARRDRLARDVVLGAMIERLAERAGATIVSTDGAGNGTSPEAQMMRNLLAAFAMYERAIIQGRIRAALSSMKARGLHTGGFTPYGFQRAKDGKHLEPDPVERDVVRMVRGWRAEGLSLRKIGQRLDDLGARPRAAKRWSAEGVRRLLAAEVA